MAYAVTADVTASFNSTRLAELTADSGSTPDSTRISNEITSVEGLIDSYLLSRYTTPVTGPAAVLTAIKPHAVALVLYGLFQDRLLAEAYSSIRDDRDRALEWLKAIRDGKGSLTGAATPETTVADTDGVAGSEPRIFGMDSTGADMVTF